MIIAGIIVQLVLLTVAVVVLFLMMGELATRVPDPDTRGELRTLEDAHVGSPVMQLPDGFGRPPGLLLVFSTSCDACRTLATETSQFLDSSSTSLVGILVSCGSEESGRDFIARHDLGRLPASIDISGNYATNALGIATSPAALAIDDAGTVRSAVAFSSYRTLAPWISSALDSDDTAFKRENGP